MSLRSAVFLDRDGVLNFPVLRNGKAFAPLSIADFMIVPEAVQALKKIRQTGLLAVVVTNQPEIARGTLTWDALESMHQVLSELVEIDGIYVCPHDPSENCSCHKPRPGLLHAAARDWDINLRASFLVGDRWRDIEAGNTAGCYTVLLDRPYSGPTRPDYHARGITEAVDHIFAVVGRAP